MDKSKIFIVIPAYNEEKKISVVVRRLAEKYQNIIVVNDNSNDNTSAIATDSGATVIDHLLNRGQGAALETGTKYALINNAEIIVHFDADGQFLVEEIEKIIEPILNTRADISMGTRFMGIKSELPLLKKYFIMPLARFIIKILYGANLSDPQNGFRAFNRKVALELNIENDGAAHCTEIIVKTIKNKWRYLEVPVTVLYDHFGQGIFSGKGRGSGGVKILKSLFMQKLIK